MGNNLRKIALAGMLSLATGMYTGGSFLGHNLNYERQAYEAYEKSRLEELVKKEKEIMFEQLKQEQSSDEIKIPHYKLSPNSCSKYARLSAKRLFKKEYHPANAWDLKYDNEVVYSFNPGEIINDSTIYESLKNKVIDGTLKPGMILVTSRDMRPGEYKNYRTYRSPGKDKEGNKIEDTHAILYLGINDNGQFEFLNQWVNKIEKMTIEDFKDKKNLKPRLIIDEPNKDAT